MWDGKAGAGAVARRTACSAVRARKRRASSEMVYADAGAAAMMPEPVAAAMTAAAVAGSETECPVAESSARAQASARRRLFLRRHPQRLRRPAKAAGAETVMTPVGVDAATAARMTVAGMDPAAETRTDKGLAAAWIIPLGGDAISAAPHQPEHPDQVEDPRAEAPEESVL